MYSTKAALGFALVAGSMLCPAQGGDLLDPKAIEERPAKPKWYLGADALFLTREDAVDAPLLDNIGGVPSAGFTTDDFIDFGYQGTAEVTLGYHLDDRQAIEASYFGFGLLEWESQGGVVDPSESANFFDPAFGTAAFSDIGRFTADFESKLQNGELTYRHQTEDWLTLLGGFRYIGIDETLLMYSEADGFSDITNAGVGNYNIETENHLIGLQVGAEADVPITDWFSLNFVGKVGGYANLADHDTFLRDGSLPPGIVPELIRYSGRDDVEFAFAGEGGINLVFQITENVSLQGGYQVLWISDAAQATGQIDKSNPFLPEWGNVLETDDILYHGARGGIVIRW